MAFCAQCGTQSTPDEKFCGNCGAALAPQVSTQPSGSPPPPPPPPPVPGSVLPKAPPIDASAPINAAPSFSQTPPGAAQGAAGTGVEPGLANYGLRVVGYIIDGVILLILSIFIPRPHFGILSNSPLILIGFIYNWLLIGLWNGQTVGMKVIGIRCVNGADRSKVDLGFAALRAGIFAVFELTLIVAFLDLLWPIWDRRNQTLHDKVAKTIVIVSK